MSLEGLKEKAEEAAGKIVDEVQGVVEQAVVPPTVSPGRIVRYVLHEGPYAGQIRPAIITQTSGPDEKSAVNLQVFKGQPDDFKDTVMIPGPDGKITPYNPPTSMQSSVLYNKNKTAQRTWHWPND